LVQDVELFISIAEIAGVFVGFGALISVTRRNQIEFSQLGRIRGVVLVGLVVVVSALIPVGLDRYGVAGHDLWFICSLIFLSLIWIISISYLRKPEYRELTIKEARTSRLMSAFFWLLLEAPIHVVLILTLLGLYPNLEPAFYTTALLFHLFEAAFILVQIVHFQASTREKISEHGESHIIVH
jgi:hypothetical protein